MTTSSSSSSQLERCAPIGAVADDDALVLAFDEMRTLGPLVRAFEVQPYRAAQGLAGAAGTGICGYLAYASDAAGPIIASLAAFILVELALVFTPRRWRGVRVHEHGLAVAAFSTRAYRWADISFAVLTRATSRGARLDVVVAGGGRLRFCSVELTHLDELADLLGARVPIEEVAT